MNNRKRVTVIRGLIATVLLTGGMVGASTAPAMAAPSNCDWGVGHNDSEGWAVCFAGSGEYRAKIKCDATWPTDNYFKYGTWIRVGQGVRSYASCSNGDDVMSTGVETR